MPIANVNGININYKVEGQGEPLMMISGFPSTNWRPSWFVRLPRASIIECDCAVISLECFFLGPYTMKIMADDTVGLMDHLGIDKAHVLGISAGGMIAQELAINHPERVNKLVLACTFARRDGTSGYTSEINKAIEGL
jgi:pimeloyl-ACP methyl ester carboxylesterase